MDYSYSYSISNSPRQEERLAQIHHSYSIPCPREVESILCVESLQPAVRLNSILNGRQRRAAGQFQAFQFHFSSILSRLTRHSVRASAIASPETSESRGVTGFGTGCGKWPLGRPSPFCRFFSPTARQLVLHLDGQLKGLTLPPPSFHANFSLSVYQVLITFFAHDPLVECLPW